jgi:hypothetical protein
VTKNTFSDEIIDALSIDCVIFGFDNSQLSVLLVKHGQGISKGQWALPGGWIKYNESVDDAAKRILTAQTSVTNIYLEQLKSFGGVDRYPGKRVITVAYYALVNKVSFVLHAGDSVSDVQWVSVQHIPKMVYDHQQIFDFAFKQLKHKVLHEPIGYNLLPKKFTLLQLQELYEAILETKLDKPNFRRKMIKTDLLVPCNEKQINVAHRAANLYRFQKKVYDRLVEKGFMFEA